MYHFLSLYSWFGQSRYQYTILILLKSQDLLHYWRSPTSTACHSTVFFIHFIIIKCCLQTKRSYTEPKDKVNFIVGVKLFCQLAQKIARRNTHCCKSNETKSKEDDIAKIKYCLVPQLHIMISRSSYRTNWRS